MKSNNRKSKRIAVLLAVFFGPWAWLYTLTLDWAKCLLAWVLFVGASIFIVLGEQVVWILQGQLSDPQAVWEFGLVMSGILLATTYVWAIIDTAVKPTSWYDEYERK